MLENGGAGLPKDTCDTLNPFIEKHNSLPTNGWDDVRSLPIQDCEQLDADYKDFNRKRLLDHEEVKIANEEATTVSPAADDRDAVVKNRDDHHVTDRCRVCQNVVADYVLTGGPKHRQTLSGALPAEAGDAPTRLACAEKGETGFDPPSESVCSSFETMFGDRPPTDADEMLDRTCAMLPMEAYSWVALHAMLDVGNQGYCPIKHRTSVGGPGQCGHWLPSCGGAGDRSPR